MNKIYSGIISLVAIVAIVAGSAYAIFNDEVSITGITLGTTTAGLEIADWHQEWGATVNVFPFAQGKISPGEIGDAGMFGLRNTGDVDLTLTAKLTSASGDWGALNEHIDGITCTLDGLENPELYEQIQDMVEDDIANLPAALELSKGLRCDEGSEHATDWHSLSYWNANGVSLPGSPLIAGAGETGYVANFRLSDSATNDQAGKTITDMVITITGNQAPEVED